MAAPIFSASHAAKQGSREVRRILRARSHLACLDFDEAPEPAELKKSYRRLSLLVHPDKCQETDAKAMEIWSFFLLSLESHNMYVYIYI